MTGLQSPLKLPCGPRALETKAPWSLAPPARGEADLSYHPYPYPPRWAPETPDQAVAGSAPTLGRRGLHGAWAGPAGPEVRPPGVAEGTQRPSPGRWVWGPETSVFAQVSRRDRPGQWASARVWDVVCVLLAAGVPGGQGDDPHLLPSPPPPPVSPPVHRCVCPPLAPSFSLLSPLRHSRPRSTTWRPGRPGCRGQGARPWTASCAVRCPAPR